MLAELKHGKENWRVLTNKEIYASVKKPTVIETIRLSRLRHSIVNTNTCTTSILLIKIYLKFHKNTPTYFGHTTIIREVYRSSLKSLLSATLCMFLY